MFGDLVTIATYCSKVKITTYDKLHAKTVTPNTVYFRISDYIRPTFEVELGKTLFANLIFK